MALFLVVLLRLLRFHFVDVMRTPETYHVLQILDGYVKEEIKIYYLYINIMGCSHIEYGVIYPKECLLPHSIHKGCRHLLCPPPFQCFSLCFSFSVVEKIVILQYERLEKILKLFILSLIYHKFISNLQIVSLYVGLLAE